MKTIYHLQPSWLVKNTRAYKVFCSVTVCRGCGLRAKYEDCHPVYPCPMCGDKMQERVGKFVVTQKPILFGLIRKERGEWIIREDNSK